MVLMLIIMNIIATLFGFIITIDTKYNKYTFIPFIWGILTGWAIGKLYILT